MAVEDDANGDSDDRDGADRTGDTAVESLEALFDIATTVIEAAFDAAVTAIPSDRAAQVARVDILREAGADLVSLADACEVVVRRSSGT